MTAPDTDDAAFLLLRQQINRLTVDNEHLSKRLEEMRRDIDQRTERLSFYEPNPGGPHPNYIALAKTLLSSPQIVTVLAYQLMEEGM